ncbi:TetR/AcrR family transcriptional regulator C-terminal domain-containing protein [Histidinibacterium aquaticum]|uniref:TetR/AcrR family transcriptional regulator n=1 Tax=Histidinibacterium aquaticum TaxID=2613962 RepID=A0A5J5GDH7_9RHOB|nr:TetR/AcrR family transcriptional regulator C-terminal domain-containing protein [Histidinibacterium aquaticum]KAA9006010.1 TetR/AcrR family transcriptional regulator [Histidinibacterium aquaticum]
MSRRNLTKGKVLQAGVDFADREGLEKLSMRKLGETLGVEAMSLYNHVKNKAELLAGMTDLVVGEIARPDPAGPWRDEMRKRAQSAHEVLMRHRWAAQLILTTAEPGPNQLAYVEATLASLIGAGFTYPQADHVWNALDAYIYGFTIQRQTFPFEPESYAEAAAENLDMIPADVFPHLRGMAEKVAAREHDGIQTLDYGLEMLLDGFERELRSA